MAANTSLDTEYESAVSGLLEALQQHEDKELRRRIVGSLRLISKQSSAAVEGLSAVLKDEQMDVESQQAAAYALGAIGSREAIQGLISALHNANCHARETIVRVLAAIGNREAVRGLISGLTVQNRRLRETILGAFPRLNRQLFEAELLTAMLNEDENLQKIAVRILERLGASKGMPPAP